MNIYVDIFAIVCFVAAVVLLRKFLTLRTAHLSLGKAHELLRKERKILLEFLDSLGKASQEELNAETILDCVVKYSIKSTEAKSCAIFLMDREKNTLKAEYVEGAFPPPWLPEGFIMPKVVSGAKHFEQLIKGIPIPMGAGVIGQTAASASPALITDGKNDPRVPKFGEKSLNTALTIDTLMAVPLVHAGETLGVMAVVNKKDDTCFTQSELNIFSSIADQAAYALHNATISMAVAEKQRFDRELQVARDIQTILLPSTAPQIPGFELAGVNDTALAVGGDYFDYIQIDPKRWGIVIADVSGKGVPGAMVMSMFRSVIRSEAHECTSPAQLFRKVNKRLFYDIKEDMFVSAVYAIVDAESHTFTFSRAGHEAPLYYSAVTQKISTLSSHGMALGIDSGEVFDSLIEEKQIDLHEGDSIILYTDGVTEAHDTEGQEFGKDNLITAMKARHPRMPQQS
ncbi:SpoIIE family protein phosphatase [Oscillatoria laete-virens NRMC-F 0139]|nr:GAF domain-containing SpoIIE family protein phosphatase [Oscillatoria laete-virens]MDL5053166.1 SpoIIE family protein phosphatase [Oscillatoria laete-virens NRMC-F 0139]